MNGMPPEATDAATIFPTEGMDAAYIERNGIVRNYMAGRLSPAAATDFERYCKANPEFVEQLGLATQIHQSLRLLSAAGEPEPWERPKVRFWQHPLLVVCFLGLVGLFGTVAWTLSKQLDQTRGTVTKLRSDLAVRPLLPVKSTRTLPAEPSREAGAARSIATIGGDEIELADFRVHMKWSPYNSFRVTLMRVGQGRVGEFHRLQRDSNGDLRVGFNSSALGPGEYQIEIDGIDWRGTPHEQAWVRFDVEASRQRQP